MKWWVLGVVAASLIGVPTIKSAVERAKTEVEQLFTSEQTPEQKTTLMKGLLARQARSIAEAELQINKMDADLQAKPSERLKAIRDSLAARVKVLSERHANQMDTLRTVEAQISLLKVRKNLEGGMINGGDLETSQKINALLDELQKELWVEGRSIELLPTASTN